MISIAFLLTLLAIAVVTDLRSHRIPNLLILSGAALGMTIMLIEQPSFQTAATALTGGLVGFLMLLPLYALGKMGAGDVKLLAMVGLFLGPAGALWAGILSLLCGGILAIALLLLRHGARDIALRLVGSIAVGYTAPSVEGVMKQQLPYAAAIAGGTSIVLLTRVA